MSRHSSNEDIKKVAVPGLFSSKMPAIEKERQRRKSMDKVQDASAIKREPVDAETGKTTD